MKAPIPDEYDGYPVVTPRLMAEIDKKAIDEYGISALDLMEIAGRGVAEGVVEFLAERGEKIEGSLVTVCCGRGKNGGDGLIAARHLKTKGAEVIVFIMPPKRQTKYGKEVDDNLIKANASGVSVHEVSEELIELDVRLRSSVVIIDALLGTGASGKPAGFVHRMIQRMMKAGKPVIAVDIPSGINGETGHHSGVFITADRTFVLGLPKRGLLAPHALKNVGDLRVVELGFPKDLINRMCA
ncbi:MAG: NAD(P)H-hydrate epimerase [Elusimicrobia bacterium]|nr:MAG: NAD(P)H-hydrate epimerase [Elusimicrobiota bacterium]